LICYDFGISPGVSPQPICFVVSAFGLKGGNNPVTRALAKIPREVTPWGIKTVYVKFVFHVSIIAPEAGASV
jgi:hypothetical protein